MAFKNLDENDLLKLKLVKNLSLEELTVLVQNKNRILNNTYNTLTIKNEEGCGEFSYTDEDGKKVKLQVPLLNIVPIPFISIDTEIPEITKQYDL